MGMSNLLINMVGTTGFEPATSSVSRKRSNQLSYAPACNLIQFIRIGAAEKGGAVACRCYAVPSFTKVKRFPAGVTPGMDSKGGLAASEAGSGPAGGCNRCGDF